MVINMNQNQGGPGRRPNLPYGQNPYTNPRQGAGQNRGTPQRQAANPNGQPIRQQRPGNPQMNTGRAKATPMSRIQSQTPGSRRAAPKRVVMTAEQIEITKRNRQRERYYIKKRRDAAIKVFFKRALLFLVVLAVMCGLTAALFFVNLTAHESTSSAGWAYTVGDGREYRLPYDQAIVDGRLYVSFTDVAKMCDLAVTGSADDIRYVIKGDEAETIRFLSGTRSVWVNTVETRLNGESIYREGELYVPLDFVEAYFKGLVISVDEDKRKVSVQRVMLNELDEDGKLPKGEEPIWGELYFLLQAPALLEPIEEKEAIEVAGMPDLGFLSDLSSYEEYMNPGITTEYLVLVNRESPLSSDYVPQDLMELDATRKDGRNPQQMRRYAALALQAMYMEMEANGITDVSVTSGYRSYAYQQSVFQSYVSNEKAKDPTLTDEAAKAKVMAYSQPAGSSEHQSGLCIDMHNLPAADQAFGQTEQFVWLKENCWKFGFILRFPADKVDVTGISYEPWHYRYVGRYHAQQMYELGMCLEEYCAYLGIE